MAAKFLKPTIPPLDKRTYRALGVALLISVTSFATLGRSGAATFVATQEAETGVVAGNAGPGDTAGASAGASVKFGTAAASPPPGGGACAQPKHTISSADVTNKTNSGYPAGTQVYIPDGPDPWGGCFPGPSNTGIPAGTQLTAYSGPCTITAANTVIDSKTVDCGITVRASNVQIKNSKITAGNIFVESGSLAFSDSEVDLGSNINDEGLKGNNFTVSRVNMYGGKRQIWCNNTCTVQDSYLHDQLSDPSGVTHESSMRVEQFTTMRHNTILCNAPTIPPDAGCSADQTGYPDFTTIHDNTMDKNLYMATNGGYCAYGGDNPGKPFNNDPQNATNIHFTNNVFQRGTTENDKTSIPLTDKRRYTCGYYGVTSSFNGSKAGFIFSGNMWDDGLLFINDTTYPYGAFF